MLQNLLIEAQENCSTITAYFEMITITYNVTNRVWIPKKKSKPNFIYEETLSVLHSPFPCKKLENKSSSDYNQFTMLVFPLRVMLRIVVMMMVMVFRMVGRMIQTHTNPYKQILINTNQLILRGALKKHCIFHDIWQKGRVSTDQNQISGKHQNLDKFLEGR